MEAATTELREGSQPRLPLGLLGDNALARLAGRGHPGAFEAIFKRHHQAIYRYCHSILANPEDAADALQNTMTRVLRALPGESREIALKPWLYRIAHNESLRLAEKQRSTEAIEEAGELADEASEQRDQSRDDLHALVNDLQLLSEKQRSSLVMRELIGLKYNEIAAAFEVSPAAAKQSVYTARVALHDLAEGRSMACEDVRRSLSENDGRKLRGRRLRAHLRGCPGCRSFEVALHDRPAALGALAPAIPATVVARVLAGLAHGGGGAGSGGAMAALGGVAAQTAGMTTTAKVLAVAAVVAAGGGAVGAGLELPASRNGGPTDAARGSEPAGSHSTGSSTRDTSVGSGVGPLSERATNRSNERSTMEGRSRQKDAAARGASHGFAVDAPRVGRDTGTQHSSGRATPGVPSGGDGQGHSDSRAGPPIAPTGPSQGSTPPQSGQGEAPSSGATLPVQPSPPFAPSIPNQAR